MTAAVRNLYLIQQYPCVYEGGVAVEADKPPVFSATPLLRLSWTMFTSSSSFAASAGNTAGITFEQSYAVFLAVAFNTALIIFITCLEAQHTHSVSTWLWCHNTRPPFTRTHSRGSANMMPAAVRSSQPFHNSPFGFSHTHWGVLLGDDSSYQILMADSPIPTRHQHTHPHILSHNLTRSDAHTFRHHKRKLRCPHNFCHFVVTT